jgi:iron complex outermembrane recepter protein
VRGKCFGTAAALLLALTILCGVTRADEPVYDIDIPSMNAAQALNRFAEQTGAIMLFSYDLANARYANAIRGRYTLLEGLDLLLRGTGLSGGLSDKRVVSISHVENAQRDGEEGAMLKQKTSFKTRIAAFISSIFSISAAVGEDANVSGQTSLEEIIVTAQKREENLQKVPLSISVLSGSALESATVKSMTDALTLVPGAKTSVGYQGGGTQISLRGVAANGPLFNGSSTVGYYIDSAPFGLVKNAVVPDSNVYDLERIEVVRGPQGTLYGASALNGVIRIITNRADLDEFELKVRTSASSIQDGGESYRGDMAVNLPLVEGKLAARAVVGYEDIGGWIDRPNRRDGNDGRARSARLKINAQPTEDLSIGLSGWASRTHLDAPPTGLEGNTTPSLVEQPLTTDYDIFGLNVGYDFSGVSLSSATTYLDYKNFGVLDLTPLMPTGTPFPFQTDFAARVFSEEVVVSSTRTGAWRWSAGAFYRDGEDGVIQPLLLTDFTDTSESFAIFGEVTRALLDSHLELTVGLRYFEDTVESRENIRHTGVATQPLYKRGDSFDALSPRVVLTWFPTDGLTIYSSYAEGFRSGASQNALVDDIAPNFGPMSEDTLKNYEIGAKGNLLDGRLSFDSAVYFIDWQGVQQSLFVQVAPGIGTSALINGQSASGIGIDLAITTRPLQDVTLGVSASWNDLRLDGPVMSSGIVLFNEGDRLNTSAEYTYGALAEYAVAWGDYEARFSVSANYSSKLYRRSISDGALLVALSDDQLFVRANLSLASANHWTATLFADNLNNEAGSPSRDFDELLSTRVRPRTLGLQLEYRY